ncbi:SAM-dependent methyltransferase [Nocardioides mangrovicus]|uniref:SAM-dependent methyltransferase n=1 Tax=Nocardioides mangrovicus TaxID=2478913 RepID=A0A3L8P228_9ACTN|nr:SAM-dependent methyltransferase [Nocardioides mangrovicus]
MAEQYERGRPSYPDDAASWLTRGIAGSRVLELGAGTGKLTEVLDRTGCDVIATDPDERMLYHLRHHLPDLPVAVAAAERIPLPSRSVDVVVAAQAFHWFDLPRAVPEIARVLRPYGVLALVWNYRDEQVPWVKKLGRLIGGPLQESDPTVSLAGFEQVVNIEQQSFRHWHSLDRGALLDMVSSRSYIATLEEAEREEKLAEVSGLYDDYGRGADGMRLPYVTRCYRIALRDLAPEPDPRRHAASRPRPTPDEGADPVDAGEPTVAMDRADLPLGRRSPRPEDPDDGPVLIDLR